MTQKLLHQYPVQSSLTLILKLSRQSLPLIITGFSPHQATNVSLYDPYNNDQSIRVVQKGDTPTAPVPEKDTTSSSKRMELCTCIVDLGVRCGNSCILIVDAQLNA